MQLSIQMALNATAELAAIDAFGPMIRVLKVWVTFFGVRVFQLRCHTLFGLPVQVGGSEGSATPLRDISAATPWARASAAGMGQTGFGGFR